jgi:hypothetical protein
MLTCTSHGNRNPKFIDGNVLYNSNCTLKCFDKMDHHWKKKSPSTYIAMSNLYSFLGEA